MTFYHHLFPALLGMAGFPIYWNYAKKKREEKRKRQLRVELRDALQILEGWIQAGSSIERAMIYTEKELRTLFREDCEIVEAFHMMNGGISINRSAEEVWCEFAQNSNLEEAEIFSHIFGLVRRRGGKLSEISTHVIHQITTSIATEEEIQTMIQGKKLEMRVMCVVPIFILLYMSLFGADMIQVMYTTWIGKIIMTICLCVYVSAWILGERMVNVKV
ncbi:MAG: type II secretion system F family protein [Lachnospiraceae bacterium]